MQAEQNKTQPHKIAMQPETDLVAYNHPCTKRIFSVMSSENCYGRNLTCFQIYFLVLNSSAMLSGAMLLISLLTITKREKG